MAKAIIGELIFQRCSTCATIKPAADFYFKGGRWTTQCKACLIKKTAEWVKANPDKRAANWRKWMARNRERHNAQCRDSYRKNADTQKAYVERNRENVRRIKREWAKRNLPYVNAQWHKRRARLAGNGGTHSKEDIAALLTIQNGKCANLNCLRKLSRYQVDHIVPLVTGGTNSPDNLQLLCPTCNQKKNAKSPERWAKENGLLFT